MNTFFSKVAKWLTNFNVVVVVYIILALVASLQSYFGGTSTLVYGDNLYTHYNNYVIFKQSFFHLIELKDLYIDYPAECGDLFKYSPAFALLFAPFAILPDLPGLILFNVLNALVLFWAIRNLPGFESNKKVYMLWFVLIELMTSMQNSQTNALIAGMLILAFVFLEKDKIALGTLFIVLPVFIKLFGIVAFVLFLIYPKKPKFILYSAIWVILLTVLPLIVVPFEHLLFLYKSWGILLSQDHSVSLGFSVMGWLDIWFGINFNKTIMVLTGAFLFLLPFIRYKQYNLYHFRTSILASILIWIIIFNHKAESPTFVISMAGLAIWFFSLKLSLKNKILIFASFIFTSLTTTDIFPSFIRHNYLYPYIVKAVPSILVWFWIIYELTLRSRIYLEKQSV